MHVNPWITLFAIDLPAVIALAVFRPRRLKLLDWPPMPRFAVSAVVGIAVLGVSAPILALNEPAVVTSTYEVLEPETWVGKKLPILQHIDIGEKLSKGNWLILLYHHDCPDCIKAIAKYEQMAHDLAGNEDFLRIALIEVPPYGRGVRCHWRLCVALWVPSELAASNMATNPPRKRRFWHRLPGMAQAKRQNHPPDHQQTMLSTRQYKW